MLSYAISVPIRISPSLLCGFIKHIIISTGQIITKKFLKTNLNEDIPLPFRSLTFSLSILLPILCPWNKMSLHKNKEYIIDSNRILNITLLPEPTINNMNMRGIYTPIITEPSTNREINLFEKVTSFLIMTYILFL